MATWFRPTLSPDEQTAVLADRERHPDPVVRRKMLVLWAVHLGHSRDEAARIASVGIATAKRYVLAYRDGGLDGLRRCERHRPTSELAAHADAIQRSLNEQPVRTTAEAIERIHSLTGLRRGLTQTRTFLASLGFTWQRSRAVPVPPQKSLTEHVAIQREFLDDQLQPALDAAQAGEGHVFFVDAAHFVYGTFLCCLWSIVRIFVRAASGRQRFNVLGAWNALTRTLLAVTNTTVVNTDTMCELLRTIAAQGLVGPITVVLDNARYQRNRVVQGLAAELGVRLLYLPSYSPNLNLIERLWGFAKRKSVYGKYHANFAAFRSAIETTLEGIPTRHADALASLMTLQFQTFEDVSLLTV